MSDIKSSILNTTAGKLYQLQFPNSRPRIKLLFLDDDSLRIQSVFAVLGRAMDITAVNTVEACVQALEYQQFDLISLDHDLWGNTFVDSNQPDTGMEVVRQVVFKRWAQSSTFIIHTLNFLAWPLMASELAAAGYAVRLIMFDPYNYAKEVLELALRKSTEIGRG